MAERREGDLERRTEAKLYLFFTFSLPKFRFTAVKVRFWDPKGTKVNRKLNFSDPPRPRRMKGSPERCFLEKPRRICNQSFMPKNL